MATYVCTYTHAGVFTELLLSIHISVLPGFQLQRVLPGGWTVSASLRREGHFVVDTFLCTMHNCLELGKFFCSVSCNTSSYSSWWCAC